MNDNYTTNLRKAIEGATAIACRYQLDILASEHLLYGLISCEGSAASSILCEFRFSKTALMAELERTTQRGNRKVTPRPTPNTNAIFQLAINISARAGVGYVSTEHLLLALLETPDCRACALIRKFGIDIDALREKVRSVVYFNRKQVRVSNVATVGDQPEENEKQEKTPLDGFGFDLTLKAKRGELDPVIGRENEIERIISTLSRRLKNNPVLVGEAGVGKSAVVEGLAQAIVKGDVPDTLAGKRVFSLNLSGLIISAASIPSFVPPAPTKLWISSMNSIVFFSCFK